VTATANETTLDVAVDVRFTPAGTPLAVRHEGRIWAVAAEPVHWFDRDAWWDIRRDGRAAKWCPEWYFHPEGVSRVAALWRAWEHLRLDGATGISVWWKDHADHHMSVLLDPRGPFYKCDMQKHRDPAHLEPKKAPEGWFPDVRALPA
jgi:hypothetical protein